ncbi:hypothetical protein J5N97_004877 [Dioscorea zingiberensis]|uniref:Peptidase M16 C-terminal domain-containing protein n=1 Tax=Dioscorea zingiberensis TaxID=325984 RepID=A0A9D5HS95_9LILI|nr:hypothetical protein J5N97_004877 [Dioscorea zingiberensis]
MDELLPVEPVGVEYGILNNGLSYYVRSNPKPRMRAALALAVKVGSVLEEEGLELLTLNALTSSDETIYELLVPVDKPGLLSKALSVLAEFSSEVEIYLSPVCRAFTNWSGKVIRTVSPETVKRFYQKWYHLSNMAVVAVGDFIDTQSVVELIKIHFGEKVPSHVPPVIPVLPVPSHNEPRFSCFVESEAAGHFFRNEPIVGIEYELSYRRPSCLVNISPAEVSKYAANFCTSCSCVIKIVEPRACARLEDLKAAVSKVNALEESRHISPWDDEHVPEEIVGEKPIPGWCQQVIFTGFAYGGLSELSEDEYFSCSMGSTISGEIGVFGYKPSVLMDMLAGKRAEVSTRVGAYMRTFSGDCSPSDLETALQLVYQLFTTNVEPRDEEVKIVMQMAEEAILAQERDPYNVFANRVRELNYGNSYFFRPIRIGDLKKVNPIKACEYFNDCFKDPSTFTVVLVGNIDPAVSLPLILQYLGGIPRTSEPILNYNEMT